MANTVNYLTYANTFGDWVVTTNNLARENNDFAANNYTKPTGTLYLNAPTLGLQVANNAVIAGQLQVQGIGSSAYIQNNLQVGTQVYFSNSVLGLTNTGDMIVGGNLTVGGKFIITGTTVNSTNNYTLNANNTSAANASFSVNRGTTGANAAIYWNENVQQWQLYDIVDTVYYKIITTDDVTSSLNSTSANTAASAAAANTLSSTIAAANTWTQAYVNSANTYLQNYTNTANTSMKSYVDGNLSINSGINATQNTRISVSEGVDAAQNTRMSIIEGVDLGQNTTITAVNGFAAGAFTTANGANGLAAGAFTTANGANGLASGAFAAANTKVASITGTANQITANVAAPNVLLSLPQSIHTAAAVQFGSFGVGTAASGTSGEIRATNNITAYYSDDRLKTRLGPIENAVEKVNSLNGFYYEANQTAQDFGYTVKKEVGLSAQEVQAILPEIVVPAPIDENYLTIHYERVVPLLVEAIKELSREIEELKKK